MNLALDWPELQRRLDERGFAVTPPVLSAAECNDLMALYSRPELFRNRVVMAAHNFGSGEYQYFNRPLPVIVQQLRQGLYPPLADVANRWAEWLTIQTGRYPEDLASFEQICAEHGQRRPTPLLLRYRTGDYNCLHQDLYGDIAFPLQLTVLLSAPGSFQGGEFLLVEQRPRAQSRGQVVPLAQGQAVIFATRQHPVPGVRGHYRAQLRHGVSELLSGERFTLGIIFHDAR